MPVRYDATFNLGSEIEEIIGPLAAAVVDLPKSLVRAEVAAVHSAGYDVLAWAVRALVQRGTADERSVRAFAELERDTLPDDALTDGAWAAALVTVARLFTEPLSDALSDDPGPSRSTGETLSDELVSVLRPLDTAAATLETRAVAARVVQDRGTFAEHKQRKAAAQQVDRIAGRLAALGVKPTG